MASTVKRLTDEGLVSPPKWLSNNVMYETMMGSIAYGVNDDSSDVDIYGWAIPPKEIIFPHLAGEIEGFGRQKQRFEQWQHHHVKDSNGQEYDFQIFSIVKMFTLLMENNPNVIDAMFTPQRCVLHITRVGTMVRESRKQFLHKGSWHKFKGYAYSQLHKMSSKDRSGKRKETYDKFGFDCKFAYHVVRLLYEAEMILESGDIDLERHREHLKAIRRGEVTEEEIRQWASDKEKGLEKLYETSKLPYSPDEPKIKALLMACLEDHYGSLEKCVVEPDAAVRVLREVQEVLERNAKVLG